MEIVKQKYIKDEKQNIISPIVSIHSVYMEGNTFYSQWLDLPISDLVEYTLDASSSLYFCKLQARREGYRIFLRGNCTPKEIVDASVVICILPEGYRPKRNIVVNSYAAYGDEGYRQVSIRLDIKVTGEIILNPLREDLNRKYEYLSIDNISFEID